MEMINIAKILNNAYNFIFICFKRLQTTIINNSNRQLIQSLNSNFESLRLVAMTGVMAFFLARHFVVELVHICHRNCHTAMSHPFLGVDR